MTIALASILDTAAAGPLRAELRKAVDGGRPVVIDGSAVERTGQACLQVLVAAKAAADGAGLAFGIQEPSAALTEMATLAGLHSLVAAA